MERCMIINVPLFFASIPQLAYGAFISLVIAGSALLIGFIVGVLLALAQTSTNVILKKLVGFYVGVVRGTPMLIHIVFLYYVLSGAGLSLSALLAAIIAIGLNSSAYVSQIMRSGINSVNKGQLEAAKTLGIPRKDVIVYIIIPQAVRVILPALGNETVTLIKDSSLASIIGVTELYQEGKVIISHTYDALTVYCALAFFYLIMTTAISTLVHYYEKRINQHVEY